MNDLISLYLSLTNRILLDTPSLRTSWVRDHLIFRRKSTRSNPSQPHRTESVITSGKTRESPLLLLVNRDSQAASQRSRGIRDLFEPTVRMYYQPSQYAFMEVNPTER